MSTLPIVSGQPTTPMPQTNFAEPIENNFSNETPVTQGTVINANQSSNETIELIQKLAQLHDAGALNDEEFNMKKSELLSRL